MKLINNRKQSLAIPVIILSGFLLNGLILGMNKSLSDKNHQGQLKHFALQNQAQNTQDTDEGNLLTKIVLDDQKINKAGIKTQTAGPQTIKNIVKLAGETRFNDDLTSHITPPLSGLVKALSVNLGDQVKKDQLLVEIASTVIAEKNSALVSAQKRLEMARNAFAREKASKIIPEQGAIYSQQAIQDAELAVHNAQQKLRVLGANPNLANDKNEDLNLYEIRAPFDGIVVEKKIGVGVAVKEDDNIMTISDLSSLWAEFQVSAKELSTLRVGDQASIEAVASGARVNGRLSYLGLLASEQNQTAIARVTMENPQMAWRPGLTVNIEIVADEVETQIAVNSEAVSVMDGEAFVFVRTVGGFIAQPVITGKTDNQYIEIVKGLKPGAEYAINADYINNYPQDE